MGCWPLPCARRVGCCQLPPYLFFFMPHRAIFLMKYAKRPLWRHNFLGYFLSVSLSLNVTGPRKLGIKKQWPIPPHKSVYFYLIYLFIYFCLYLFIFYLACFIFMFLSCASTEGGGKGSHRSQKVCLRKRSVRGGDIFFHPFAPRRSPADQVLDPI